VCKKLDQCKAGDAIPHATGYEEGEGPSFVTFTVGMQRLLIT